MRTLSIKPLLFAGLFCAGLAGAAQAMPVGEPNGMAAPRATLIDYPCGRGWRLNDWDECVPKRWRRPPPPPPPRWGGPPPPWADRGPPPPWEDGPRPWHRHRPPPPRDWDWN